MRVMEASQQQCHVGCGMTLAVNYRAVHVHWDTDRHTQTHTDTHRMCTSTKPKDYNLSLVAAQLGGVAPAGAEDDKADRKRRRRRRSKAGDADMEQKWGFLTELDAADQSWLHFALYSAYQSQRYSWYCTLRSTLLTNPKGDFWHCTCMTSDSI